MSAVSIMLCVLRTLSGNGHKNKITRMGVSSQVNGGRLYGHASDSISMIMVSLHGALASVAASLHPVLSITKNQAACSMKHRGGPA